MRTKGGVNMRAVDSKERAIEIFDLIGDKINKYPYVGEKKWGILLETSILKVHTK
jgi:hypothetical protein